MDKIVRAVFAAEGLTPNGVNYRQGGGKIGNRAEWTSREYLEQHLVAKIHQLYPGQYQAGDVQRVAEIATKRMLEAAKRDPQTSAFNPRRNERFRPSAALAVPESLQTIANRQYKLTKGNRSFTPITVNLNNGGWDVQLSTAIGSGKVPGVYILRNSNGAIYKVGKATDLVGRMERYAADWVASGIQVRAEVYALTGLGLGSTDLLRIEMVLRGSVREDGWDLTPAAGAADGDWADVRDPGTGGWFANPVD